MQGAAPLSITMVLQRFRPAFSGHGVQVEQLCDALARRGHRVRLLTARQGTGRREAAPARETTAAGVEVRRLGWRRRPSGTRPLAFALASALALARDRADVVHVHALTDALYTGRLVTRARGMPLVFEMTLVGADDPLTVRDTAARPRAARWWLYGRADAFVAISPALAASYERAGLDATRLHLIPQAVDTRRFVPADEAHRRDARTALGLAPDGPVVAFVGSLIRRKGIDVLLAAWPAVHARHPGATLVLAGKDDHDLDGADARWLAEHLAACPQPARERIVRTGVVDHVEGILAASDLLVLPSRAEGFGSVLIEAMASGLPVVATELPGITDFVLRDGDADADAVIVPQEAPAVLGEAIGELLGRPAAMRAMGARARARATVEFSFDAITDRYERLYRSLAA